MGNSNFDPASLVALIVSFVALVIALFQVVQQYAATAYDYRRCSPRTIGQWATRTRRKFIWDEVRFEITFSTPRISIAPRPSFYHKWPSSPSSLPSPSSNGPETVDEKSTQAAFSIAEPSPEVLEPGARNARPTTKWGWLRGRRTHHILQQNLNQQKQYCLVEDPRFSKSGVLTSWFDAEDDPWFLQSKSTVPEAKCSWLALLEDTRFTNLGISLVERRSSYDFVPADATRPIATADQVSFLTLLSLMRVNWRNRGEDGELSGRGDNCEVLSRTLPGLGQLYIYQGRDSYAPFDLTLGPTSNVKANPSRYYLTSEAARLAMFNCFDLGFAQLRTHSPEEVRDSLQTAFQDTELARDASESMEADGRWCPGLGEVVACWATPSMPKVVAGTSGPFKSIWSAHSCACFIAMPHISAILGGHPANRVAGEPLPTDQYLSTSSSIVTFHSYVQRWYTLNGELGQAIYPHLEWASSHYKYSNSLSDNEISWKRSLECLNLVQELDDLLRKNLPNIDQAEMFSRIAHQQFKRGVSVFPDASRIADQSTTEGAFWLDSIPDVVAHNTVEAVSELASLYKHHEGVFLEEFFSMVMINRLIRGALWSLHNGNAPSKEQRPLECSLTSLLLADNATVYIA